MASILRKANTGAKKTWLLYGANLSFSQYQRYLKTLVDLELILEKDGLYITTAKGRAFIRGYVKLLSLLEEPGNLEYVEEEGSNKKGIEITSERV
jgi:predicted transcriptional regulator